MNKLRFSMGSLMVAVALLALTLAGIQAVPAGESNLWASLLMEVVVFTMLTAISCVAKKNALTKNAYGAPGSS
jgi:hypothetical protein